MRVPARGSVAGLARKIPLHFVRRDFKGGLTQPVAVEGNEKFSVKPFSKGLRGRKIPLGFARRDLGRVDPACGGRGK